MAPQRKPREFGHTDNELLTMMTELKVTSSVDHEKLKKSFFAQIKAHHSDKGGEVTKAQRITQAYRVLKNYLDYGVQLPNYQNIGNGNSAAGAGSSSQKQSSSAASEGCPFGGRSGCRTSQQAPQAPPNGFEDFGDFNEVNNKKRRRKKGKGGADQEEENGQDNAAQGQGTSNGTKAATKFINGYTYEQEDYSTYEDPMERPDRQKDGLRRIRGGLLLYKDFQRGLVLPPEFQELGTLFTDNNVIDNIFADPKYQDIATQLNLRVLDDFNAFAERLRTFVHISWAMDGGASQDARIMLQKVKMTRVSEDDDSLYEVNIPPKTFDADLLTTGLTVEVRLPNDNRMWANAVIEQVSVENHTITVFFVDPLRLHRILTISDTVNIGINCSAFVYRSQLRSIEYIQRPKHGRDMKKIIFPKPEFTEKYEEFVERRAKALTTMPFREEADHNYNVEQKNAIFSIVDKSHHPWPFILFGPPGTGKTITLIEAIRHLVLQSNQNRILVCTPSKMAADNFAEALLQHGFLDNKYVFRMHSLSTMARTRNKKLDPISYLPKEAKRRFFGIPDRQNLKMFRVIISTLSTSSYLISAGGLRGYFTHLFVDEAGQALETEVWIPIGGLVGPQTSVILAGDPKQLGPVLNVNNLKHFGGFDCSMLKRIMSSEHYLSMNDEYSIDKEAYNNMLENIDNRYFVVLRQTYRSHYYILRPCSYLFYHNMLVVDDSESEFTKLSKWEGLPTKDFPIIFHSSAGSHDEQGANKSFQNEFEANWVGRYVERLLRETGTAEKDIGVISPYKNQVIRLRHMLAMYPGVTVDSVEGFQGSEREVIIISTVRQHDMGFLRCDLRLNTSISRAKYLLIVIGNEQLLSYHQTWKKFIYYCRHHGGFVNKSGEKMMPIELPEQDEDDAGPTEENGTADGEDEERREVSRDYETL